jgi:hypothetical protein
MTDRIEVPRRLDEKGHTLARFFERWWPLTDEELRLRAPHKKAAARKLREAVLERAIMTAAYPVERIPDEGQSIWAFTMWEGPHTGKTAMMVVSDDGTVRTVLPPDTAKPDRRALKFKR